MVATVDVTMVSVSTTTQVQLFTLVVASCFSLALSAGEANAPSASPSAITSDQLAQMALWPQVSIRALLSGEEQAQPSDSSSEAPPPPVDLLFVLQAANATFFPNATTGELIGGSMLLRGIQETIVSFADRPYRTMDAIPVGTFFGYDLVADFFAGDNPPNAILAGELPGDVAAQITSKEGESRVLPFRRLLGTVLGKARYDSETNELRFDLPAGADIFRADGKPRFVEKEAFDEIRAEFARAGAWSDYAEDAAFPTLQQISIFIDPLRASPEHPVNARSGSPGRKLLQRRRGGFAGGRAGAVRVGGGGFARPSAGRRGFNFNSNNFIRGGRTNVFVGGRRAQYRLVGGAGLGYWGDPYWGGGYGFDPYYGSRALAYAAPVATAVPVPVPEPVPVPMPGSVPAPVPPSPSLAALDVAAALSGTWRGDGGGVGMGRIVVIADASGGAITMSASPTGCVDCAPGCRWSVAEGPVLIEGGSAAADLAFTTCGGDGSADAARGKLEMAQNGRNVLYWNPAMLSSQWIRNA